jgi:8-oxo-dGTP diphosphatase
VLDRYEVLAAGGLVWRQPTSVRRATAADGDEVEVLVVHRPRYDDWTLPKGKLDAGESLEACARREVAEETGLICRLGPWLADVTYDDHRGRSKLVRYWAMTVRSGAFAPNDEVDEACWVPLSQVAARLTYAHDHQVLAAFALRRA